MATIHRTGRYTFEIASGTRPGLVHTQDVLHLTCSCEAGRQGLRCWHLVRALLIEQGYRPRIKRKAHRASAPQITPQARIDV
jgi:hypothetical protein